MPPARLLDHAAAIVSIALAGTPADAALREMTTRQRGRFAPAERRAVSRAVFAFFRWRGWIDNALSLQKQVESALGLQTRFDEHPSQFKAQALAALGVPGWVRGEMEAVPPEWLRQLQREPALWIRTKRGLEAAVAAALGDCAPASPPAAAGRLFPTALRYAGTDDLYRSRPFQAGEFEIQDLASQWVGHACAPQPGETWWDACAGEGGKTLHLSDLMDNKGLIWASDRSARRLEVLRRRAARARAFNYRAAAWDGGPKLPTRTRFDGVLVDGPCTGVGTWQRNPHSRWTTQARDVAELAGIQAQLLDRVAPAVKSGGRLVYSVCTLTRLETVAVAESFGSAHPDFEPLPLSALGTERSSILLWPQELNANGMFIAAWRRR